MLKLDHLDLSGFKSFVDPVELRFAGGITAIVGPNGCGKSNISDAMTWVLGEQSAKNLRGGTMEDVIFSGSEGRKPTGMAEVTLTLRTDPSFPASQDGVLTLGRRVFRSGESQYRMNGKTVRLKEIKDLLMDTGLGIRAYSVIEQGKIGMILSGKPQERRKLLEEAAGITRYKARKRVAEVKLEEARGNLLRLDDIVSEVERALRSLKRQASAARRWKEKERERRLQLERVLHARWRELARGRAALVVHLESAVGRDAGLTAALSRDEAELARGREELDELARRVAEQHKEVADLAATIEGRQEFLKGGRERLQELAERATAGRALAERRTEDLAQLDRQVRELDSRREELEGERSSAADAVSRDEGAIVSAQRQLAQAEARLRSVRGEQAGARSEAETLGQRRHQGEIELEKANYRSHHLDGERIEHGERVRQATENLETAEARVTDLEAAIEERRAGVEALEGELEGVMRKEAQASELVRSLESSLSGSRQRRRLLEELAAAHAERRTTLRGALAEAGIEAPVHLAERVEALEGWERSLDLYLGELADGVVLPAGTSSRDLAESLAGRAAARLITPLEAPGEASGDGEADEALLEDPAVVLSLGEALGLAPELARALPPAWLVSSAADAERLARAHRGAAFLSPEGLWFAGGVTFVEGARSEPGVLERDRELTRLEEEIEALEARRLQAESDLEGRIEERAELARRKNAEESAAAGLSQELAVARARREDAAAVVRRLDGQREELAKERQRLDAETAKIRQRQAGLEGEIRAAEERLESLADALERAEAEVEAAQENRESLKESSAGRRGRLELLSERLESLDRELERLRREITEGRDQQEAWSREAETLERRRGQLSTDLDQAESELQGALERRAAAEEATLAEQHRLDVRRESLRTLESELGRRRAERDEVRQGLEALRVQEAELKGKAGHLAEAFRAELKVEPPETPEPAAEDEPPLPELEKELASLQATLDRLGPVNLLAMEEYEEQEERHRFLTEQRRDVATSVESLKKTIREINQTSSDRFAETFAEVNANFGEIFEKLFRGGEATMRLMDEEDILETGIEIVARPPGKRLQNLMLMSGGEKALTAVALLFALFKTKPSPFCILDEVDAPLDDANTVRFAEMLREMSADTQFLVITHNKITMEAASTLYGVTMEERGVSKLVAVELDQVQPDGQVAKSA